jgi:hypothetical protein
MPGNEGEQRSSRRVAGAVLGGLAMGAVFGAGITAQQAQAGNGGPAAAVVSDLDTQRSDGSSIQEQFRTAFTPGALEVMPIDDALILIPEK